MSQNPERVMSEAADDVSEAVATPSTLLFAVATGVIIINLFAPQTLVGIIGPSLGFSERGAGLVAMASLLGYAAGLFFLVPLADLMENRQLVLRMLLSALIMAVAAAFAPTGWSLLIFLFLLGAACSAIQILVPIAAAMAPPEHRGQVIGNVMSGVMVGILVSRPLASLIADFWGWRSFYAMSAATLALLAAVLALRLPERRAFGQRQLWSPDRLALPVAAGRARAASACLHRGPDDGELQPLLDFRCPSPGTAAILPWPVRHRFLRVGRGGRCGCYLRLWPHGRPRLDADGDACRASDRACRHCLGRLGRRDKVR
nr:MFS transporter [Rhizobium tropici]